MQRLAEKIQVVSVCERWYSVLYAMNGARGHAVVQHLWCMLHHATGIWSRMPPLASMPEVPAAKKNEEVGHVARLVDPELENLGSKWGS